MLEAPIARALAVSLPASPVTSSPPRILFLVHGFPPREAAGTEQHTATLAAALQARGHAVRVLAATRAPGRPQYSHHDERVPVHGQSVSVRRLVQNVPARPLAQGEADPAVDAAVDALIRGFRPDLVHVQHLQFLSSTMLPAPSAPGLPWVATLHDAWGWCPAGGTLLEQPEGHPCPGPEARRCAPCAAAWRPVPTAPARALMATAGLVAPLVAPERLHRAWQRLPAGLRRPVARGRAPVEDPTGAETRARHLATFLGGARELLAPSRHLARLAEAALGRPVRVVPHGVPEVDRRPTSAAREGPFLFLGTLARHKGPDLVVAAWRRAFPGGQPGLRLVGPVQDAALALGHPTEGPLPHAGAQAALRSARALVMGSRWPENAPLVVLEARAAGVPVVAPRLGGLPELVEHGRDGLLYDPGSAEDLARCLLELVARDWQVAPPPRVADMVDATLARYAAALGGETGAGRPAGRVGA